MSNPAELFFWLWIMLIVVAVAALPGWGYTRERWPYRNPRYRYYPAAASLLVALLVLLLFWLGFIAIAWPWAAAPVVVE